MYQIDGSVSLNAECSCSTKKEFMSCKCIVHFHTLAVVYGFLKLLGFRKFGSSNQKPFIFTRWSGREPKFGFMLAACRAVSRSTSNIDSWDDWNDMRHSLL